MTKESNLREKQQREFNALCKKIYETEILYVTTVVFCNSEYEEESIEGDIVTIKRKKCNNLLHVLCSARRPDVNVVCPCCKTRVHRRILSDKFINNGIFNIALQVIQQNEAAKIEQPIEEIPATQDVVELQEATL